MRAVIFANGEFHPPEDKTSIFHPGDVIIAADGGARHCETLGLLPHYVIGDFDSLTPAELSNLSAQGVQLIRFAVRKDFTDLELALRHALTLGCSQILIYGALGSRWDQTLANLLLMSSPHFKDISIRLVDGEQEITLLRPQRIEKLAGKPGDTLSLIPLAGDAQGITTQGLEYLLRKETLYFGSTRGVSNVLTNPEVYISFDHGLLVCTLIHH